MMLLSGGMDVIACIVVHMGQKPGRCIAPAAGFASLKGQSA
jgi:hypothetical protein